MQVVVSEDECGQLESDHSCLCQHCRDAVHVVKPQVKMLDSGQIL